MTMVKCVHYWLVESPQGQFSLAKCKKCGEYNAMSNTIPETIWAQPSPKRKLVVRDDTERKTFLQERIKEDKENTKRKIVLEKTLKDERRKKIPIQYTNGVKTQVLLNLIRGKTITETSRITKVPTSTIRDWRKIYSNYTKVKTSGNTEIFKKIIIEKIETEGNLSSIARDYNIPRRTLRNWVEKLVA